jgi:hypothetical protein
MTTATARQPISDWDKLRDAVVKYDDALRGFVNTVAPLNIELGYVVDALPTHYSNRLQIGKLVAHVRNTGRAL